MLRERIHDPYKSRHKRRESTVCPVCGACFCKGRWQWTKARSTKAREKICEACRRIKDKYPAGLVTLKGAVVTTDKTGILNLVRHVEQLEKAEHPLHRIMDIEQKAASMVISTTDVHLARRMGEALHRAYKGTLAWLYPKEGDFVRVNWTA